MRAGMSYCSLFRKGARCAVTRAVVALVAASALWAVAAVHGLHPIAAAAKKSGANASVEKPSWIDPQPFQYSPQDKPNPFKPFLRRAPSSQQEEEPANRGTLSPLERITPSQLKLEGILRRGEAKASAALVQLPDGKAYILRPGTRIGTDGARVESIEEDRVVIREYFIDVMGEKQAKQTVLKLPQSAGEKNE